VIKSTGFYARNVSLAYGRSAYYNRGRYFAAWEERDSQSSDLGQIFTAHSEPYFNSAFTTPIRLDNILGATENYARNPSISCQFNDTDNDLGNITEVVLFDRAYNGTLTDFDIVGCYNKEAATTDNWAIFGMNASSMSSDYQPRINFDPGYSNFLATYYNNTDQKLRYLVKYMDMADPYNWYIIIDQYNDGNNLLNPYPQVEINPVYLQVAHIWTAEGTSGGVAMFDAEYSSVGIAEQTNSPVRVSVSPNPATSLVTFRIEAADPGASSVHLYTLQGKEVLSLSDDHSAAGVKTMQAEVSSLPSGCYLYRIMSGSNSAGGRLIVE